MRRYKSKTPWAGLLGVFLAVLVAWGLAAGAAASETPTPFGKGRLFEVSRPGAPPSYVFGTMHVTDPEVLKLPPPIARAFKGSRVLIVESDDDALDAITVAEAMFLPEGRHLKDVIGSSLYDEVVVAAEAVGLSEREVSRLRPWILCFLLGNSRGEDLRRATGQAVLDEALQNYAAKRGVPVVNLDKGAEIAALFTTHLSEADQAAMLESVIHSAHEREDRLEEVRAAYLAGDLDTLLAYFGGDGEDWTEQERVVAEKFDHELLTARNHRWIPRMKGHLDKGGAFVAVGAAHLPGEEGILNLLQEAGYRVTRVH